VLSHMAYSQRIDQSLEARLLALFNGGDKVAR
jgi:hypothetical protein